MHRLLLIIVLLIPLAFAGQQTHHHETTYQNDEQQVIQHANNPIVQRTVSSDLSGEQAPTRWRTINNDKFDNRQKTNLKSTFETKFESSPKDLDSSYIEVKHDELRKRTFRIQTLTAHQKDLRRQLEMNETILNEQLKGNNLENLNLPHIQMLVHSVQNCIRTWERYQEELQKLYRDQIFEQKKLLELYRISRPDDRDTHNQLDRAIESWESIYNKLLTMQLNEKKRNEEREKRYENLLTELEIARRSTYSPYLFKSPEYYSSSLSKISPISTSKLNHQSSIQTVQSPQQPIQMSSVSSSHSSYDSSSFSSSMKTNSVTDQPQVYYKSSQSTSKTSQNYPLLSPTSNLRPGLEENSLIFRRPESASLKEAKCLDRWFEDLGREDAEWIARNQLKNEEFFRELIRLQKLQWDTLLVEHNKNKQKSIPQTFECKLESKSLCDEEEENFKRKFNSYRIDRYPSNINQVVDQQIPDQKNQDRNSLANQQVQESHQKIQKHN